LGRLHEAIPCLEKAVQIGDPAHTSQAMQMLQQARGMARM
jgi:hypothetical protein